MKIHDSVSVVIKVDNEILMIRRKDNLRAFGGYHAFPGGKVDKEDHDVIFDQNPFFSSYHHQTIIREIEEELDFDLQDEFKQNNLLKLISLGSAMTPDFNPNRFETHFFLVELKTRPAISPDDGEIAQVEWKAPALFVQDYEEGNLLIVPPIINLLRNMEEDIYCKNKKRFDFTYDSKNEVPCIESIKGIKQLIPLSNTLPPANRTNAFVIGDEKKLLLDPSPKDDLELDRLLNTLKNIVPTHIFLTHHHPDHHERSPKLARKLNLPILLSKITLDLITKKWGNDYFKDIDIQIVKEGDVVTKWLGIDVEVMAVPGHDAGQLALCSIDNRFCIVGDLIQGVGTVVVGGEEGDMAVYMQTLKNVIARDFKFIFPSHGIATGSVFRIKQTLKHREIREEQVRELHEQGKTAEEMLPIIYKGIDSRLKPYALVNIHSHLKSLGLPVDNN